MSGTSRPRRLLVWMPPALWAALIWHLGGDDFSAPETSRILGPLVSWLLPDLDTESVAHIVAGIRKLAHPGVYGVLAGLTLNAAARSRAAETEWGAAAVALLPTALLAIADELRQSASAERTGAAFDVALDVGGGIAAVWLLLYADRRLGGRLLGGKARGRTAPLSPGGPV